HGARLICKQSQRDPWLLPRSIDRMDVLNAGLREPGEHRLLRVAVRTSLAQVYRIAIVDTDIDAAICGGKAARLQATRHLLRHTWAHEGAQAATACRGSG